MTNAQAISLVLRMATAHANGHEDCLRILRAVERAREMLKLANSAKSKKRKPSKEPDLCL